MQVDAELLSDDLQARRHALDTAHSFIVQAPAGSGKTELLIQRYLKLLGESEHPEEVLAITFTRKASAEMRRRVTDALDDARESAEPVEPHRKLTWQLARSVLSRDSEKAWRLRETPGRMRIQTLDSLSASIAGSAPLTSGLGGSSRTVTDEEARMIYRAAAFATLDWLTTDERMSSMVARVLSHLDNSTALYVAHISRMLETRDQWLTFVGSGTAEAGDDLHSPVRDRREAAIGRVVRIYLRRARDLFPREFAQTLMQLAGYASTVLRDAGVENHPVHEFARRGQFPGADTAQLEAWRGITGLLLRQGRGWRNKVNVHDGFPAGDNGQKATMHELLASLSGHDELLDALERVRTLPEPHYSDEQWGVLLALFELLPYAVAELRQQFAQHGVTDHIEIAAAASAALGSMDDPGDFALLLDYGIRHLLVDEMQDTSIGQYRMLEVLTGGWERGDGKTFFCVGDPMQSIYRFRDADVSRFLRVRRRGIGEVQPRSLLLRRNFRSGENLVHWFNTVFAQVMPLADEPLLGGIAYSESVSTSEQAGEGDWQVHPLFGATHESEASTCADVIQRCLAAHPRRNTAVLVQSRTHLPLLLAELRRRKIAYQAIEIDRLTDLPEIIDLTALTRALCHDGDRLAWLALLRGPWVGLTWVDLHALVCNDRYSTIPEILADANRMAAVSADGRSRIARFIERIEPFHRTSAAGSLREQVERAWFALDGPAFLNDRDEMENIYRFLDVVAGMEVAGTLADVADLTAQLDQQRVSTGADAICRVQVMTMHKAKGLQFDNVVLYGLGRATAVGKRALLNWLSFRDESGQDEMIISPVGPRFEVEHDRIHQFIEATEAEKDRLELDRLLYVACTRAVHALHLIGHVAVTPCGEDFRPPRRNSLLRRMWPALEGEFRRAWSERAGGPGIQEEAAATLSATRLRRVAAALPERRAPPLPAPGGGTSAPPGTESRIDYYWVGSAARTAGTIVHDYIRQFTTGPGSIDPDYRLPSDDEVLRRAERLGVQRSDLELVCERVQRSLRDMLNDEKGRWLLSGEGVAELAVTGCWKSGVESIVIDRVRIDDDGVHWIVDYKTSTHEGGDLSGFLLQEQARYRSQIEKYAAIYRGLVDAPVRAALYFPLLQSFCEIDLDSTGGVE